MSTGRWWLAKKHRKMEVRRKNLKMFIQKGQREKTKTLIQKDTCTPMFKAAIFTTAKTWKKPKWPSTDKKIDEMWYIHTQWNISHKKWNNAICSNMDEPGDYHTKWSDSKKLSYDITHKGNLKYDINERIYKTEIDSQIQKTWCYPKVKWINYKLGSNRYTLL